MSFLDENTVTTDDSQEAEKLAKKGVNVKLVDKMAEKKGRDLDGDGDVDSDDYLAARNAAIKKAKSMKESVAKDLYIKAMESSSLEEFLSDVYQDYPQHKGNSDIADYLKNYYLDAGGPLNEGSLKSLLVALGIGAASVGLLKKLDASDPVVKAIKTAQEKGLVDTPAEKKAAKDMLLRRGVWLDTGKGEGGDITVANVNKALKEAKTIELPADTTFTVDLKHLMKKHMAEGKSKEEAIVFTKKLMAKLHDKGELTVDGTKIVFKEGKKKSGYMGYTDMANEASIMGIPLESFADYYTALDLAKNIGVPVVAFSALLAIMGVQRATEFLKKGKEAVMDWYKQNVNEQEDAQLALPEPDAQDFLGDDGMDYEGGMAKSQMLKMKKYAMALCDMIDDESQLESWVQAKLTKASDYMSSVYHYLDYRKSKMNELNEDEGQNIADFLNANYKEIASKLGNPGSNFEIIGDNKVATAGDGNEGIDISFDKNHMDKLFPKDDPYNEVKELTIAGKVVYYNDYRGSKMNEAFELNGREVVDLEADGGGSIDPFIGAAYYLDTGKKLTDDEIEALVDKYPADLELGGAWWDQQR